MSQVTLPSVTPVITPMGVGGRLSSFPVVRVWLLTYLVFQFSRVDVADPDLWWHLRNAQYLISTGHFPVIDTYSYTASGAAVMPFEWLSEIPYYLAYKCAGLPAVFLLVFLLCTAIVLGVFRLSYLASHDVMSSFLAAVGGAVMTTVSIGARTLLFGWLYLVVLLLILEATRRRAWNWLWLVPPLFCLWVNSHGSWPIGIVVIGIFIGSGLVKGQWGHAYATRWSAEQLRKLLITAGASVAAVFVNPFGYHLVFYPFQVMFGGGSAGSGPNYIEEFASVDFHTPLGKLAMILILGTLLLAIFSKKRWRLDEIAYMTVAIYFALTNVRFMFLAGILAPPVFAKRITLMSFSRNPDHELYKAALLKSRGSDRRLRNAVVLVILCCVFIVSAPPHWQFKTPIHYPDGAVAYMKAHGIRGRLFHDWNWGGYLIWHAPELKVFIDARGDIYGPTGVFSDYLAAVSNTRPQAVLDKYKVEYVLMPVGSKLSEALRSSPGWTQIYGDEMSVLLRRSQTP